VEGLVEEIVYSSMLEKLYGGRQVECKDLPTLKELIEPFMQRAKCYAVERGYLVVIVNCGGYENLKNMTRRLLKRRELLEALRQLDIRIAVAADRDKNPAESIRGVLSSMGLQATGGDALTVELGGAKLAIHVIEQGGEGDVATGEIEDELRKLVEALKPELQHIAKRVEEIYKRSLTDKQKLLIYLALLERKPKIRELYELFRKAVAEASRDAVEHLGLAKGLGKALG